MKITEIAVKRPIAMSMFIMIFVIMGLYTYMKIGVELFPAINTPIVTIQTSYPGAGAQEIEQSVLKPTEDALSTLSKVSHINSIASEGSAITILQFDLTANSDQAALDVQKKIDAIKSTFPDGAAAPIVIKRDINDQPIITLALSSSRPLHETYDYANDLVKDRLQRVTGVSDVAIAGGQDREILVKVDKNKLEAYGLSLNTILGKLRSENLNQPSGRIDRPEAEYNLRVIGEYSSVDDIRKLPIPLQDGSTIRLQDVADVRDTYDEVQQYSRLNGKPAIAILLYKQSDASLVDVADSIKKELPNINKDLPNDIKLEITNDTSEFTKRSLDGTRRSLIEAIFTTAFALLIFLREWRSVFVVLLAIPTSLLSAVMMMFFAGFTFNMMSLMGLSLCIGILVDDSIVVLENIHRHFAMGKTPAQAAIDGRSEIGLAAIAITLSDVVVFAPIAFMSGMVGQFFRQFGLTVVFATLFSLFISFTLTPMAASLLFKQDGEAVLRKKGSFFGVISKRLGDFGEWFKQYYKKFLLWSLNHRKTILLFAAGAFIVSISFIPLKLIGMEFMPTSDQNTLSVSLELPIGTPITKTDKALKEVEKFVEIIPEIEYYQTSLGSSGGMGGASSGANLGRIGITLIHKADRKRTVWQIGDSIRAWAKNFKDAKIKVSESDSMGGPSSSAISIDVKGTETEKLAEVGNMVKQIVKTIPGTSDVDTNWRLGQPEIQVTLNRDKLAWHGLSVSDVSSGVRAAVSGQTAGVYRTGDKEISILVKIDDLNKADLETLKTITITTVNGTPVQLGEIAEISYGSGPTQIRRLDRQRTIQVTGNLRGRALNTVLQEVKAKLDKTKFPAGYAYSMSGQSQNMNDTFRDLLMALVLSITLVYMVLTMLYESFSTPLIRMISLPLGVVGAFTALAITHNNLNMMSMIGLIMMDGLVAKNGTLLLDYTNTLLERGYNLRDAVIEACMTRLRPIMMTTFTMIFGMLPIALSTAEGAETSRGMALVLIGGLVTSTLFTLVVIPIITTLYDDAKKKFRRIFKRKEKTTGISA